MEPTETALIVAIPEAEPVVGRFRASLDRAAAWGVPAHVTVVYPFLPPDRIDETVGHDAPRPVLEDAARAVAAHLPIRATVEAVRLIAGTPGHRPWPTVCEFPLSGG